MTEEEENKQIFKNIDKNGCHILHITEEDDHPCFTYSIGIEQCTGQPEIVVTGLEKNTAHFLINEYNNRIKDGEIFEADKFYDEFLDGFQITFKAIEEKHYENYVEYGVWLYKGKNFKALHLIWPDTTGTWPWEKKASKEYRWLLPRLYAQK